MEKLYRVAGVASRYNIVTARFANSIDRARALKNSGFKDIALFDLPEPMTRVQAAEYLLTQTFFTHPEDRAALEKEVLKRQPRSPETRVRAPRKTKAVTVEAILNSVGCTTESLSPYSTVNG